MLDLQAWQAAGAQLAPENDAHPQTIDATDCRIEDRHLTVLAQQPQLRNLNLRGTQVTDSGLRVLSALGELEFLGLSDTGVTDVGVQPLAKLSKLRYVTLADTAISDRSVPLLSSLTGLQGLNVKGTSLTAAGLLQLRSRLPDCKIIFDESLLAAELQFDREAGGVAFVEPQLLSPGGGATPPTPRTRPAVESSAEDRLARLLEDRIGDPQVLMTLGEVYSEQGDAEGAVIAFREAVRRDPADVELRFKLGVAEAEWGDWRASRENLTAAVGPAAAEYNHAVILYRQGRIADCHAALQRALQWEPEFPPAHQLHDWLAQPGLAHADPSTASPATLQLLQRALRGTPAAPADAEWKVAIQPHATIPSAPNSRSTGNINQAVHQESVQAGQILSGRDGRRSGW
jgi:tetratricopeptide (TPR) repeat protein